MDVLDFAKDPLHGRGSAYVATGEVFKPAKSKTSCSLDVHPTFGFNVFVFIGYEHAQHVSGVG